MGIRKYWNEVEGELRFLFGYYMNCHAASVASPYGITNTFALFLSAPNDHFN